MARLSKAQEQARQRIVELSGRALAVEKLGRAIVEALAVAIPHDGYQLMGIDPTTMLVNRVIAASENDGWARSEWLREVYLRSEVLTYIEIPEMMRMGLGAVAMHERQEDCWESPAKCWPASSRIPTASHSTICAARSAARISDAGGRALVRGPW